MSKRTFQPNNRRRAKTHGFRLRMRTRAGRAILGARRRKGREHVSQGVLHGCLVFGRAEGFIPAGINPAARLLRESETENTLEQPPGPEPDNEHR